MPLIKTNLLNPVSTENIDYHTGIYLGFDEDGINYISARQPKGSFEDCTDLVCIPGLIDCHVHLSQYRARGNFSPGLIDWLNDYIFSEEAKSADRNYAEKLSRLFFRELLRNGTTTSVVYTAPALEACEIAFSVARETGVRAVIGNTLMDFNSPEDLRQGTEQSFKQSVQLCEKWNRSTPLLEYVFSPRFALTCSTDLMELIGDYASRNGIYIQTHLSENTRELKLIREIYPDYDNYTDVYYRSGILGPKTLLAHVIHVSDQELELIADTDSRIVHCPDSNFFLKSGIFPLERIRENELEFGLGSDVAAGTSLSMLHTMKMFIYRQNGQIVTPAEAFYRATLGAADLLGKKNLIGSVELGKAADLVFLRVDKPDNISARELVSNLVFLDKEVVIDSTYVAGKQLYKADFD